MYIMMNNNVFLPILSLIPFIIELFIYIIFIYLASTTTKLEVSRRWRASALVGVISGLALNTMIVIVIWSSWIMQGKIGTIFQDFAQAFILCFNIILGLTPYITMPMIIIVTLGSYFRFWQDGDRLIEMYWKNPKIHYPDNAKPPYF